MKPNKYTLHLPDRMNEVTLIPELCAVVAEKRYPIMPLKPFTITAEQLEKRVAEYQLPSGLYETVMGAGSYCPTVGSEKAQTLRKVIEEKTSFPSKVIEMIVGDAPSNIVERAVEEMKSPLSPVHQTELKQHLKEMLELEGKV